MQIEKSYKPELVASKDETRLTLTALHISKAGHIEATNGRMAVRVPVILNKDEPDGMLSCDCLAYARELATESAVIIELAPKTAETVDKTRFVRPPFQEEFPNLDNLWPLDRENEYVIGLNPTLLLMLAKAMGSAAEIVIRIKNDKSPMIVKPANQSNTAIALLMPMHVDGAGAWQTDDKNTLVIVPEKKGAQ